MGKSSKKAKSDRINALRKQYDAFLEQDKKRKERNEYILGKLDNMRYSTALVPVRHKFNILDNSSTLVHHLGYHQDTSAIRDFHAIVPNQSKQYPDIQVRRNDETSIIEEISKKYILIPKTTSLLVNSYPQNRIQNLERPFNTERLPEQYPVRDIPVKDDKSNAKDSSDWRSKYEILNILKNEEKDTTKHKMGADDFPAPLTKKVFMDDDLEEVDSKNKNNPSRQVVQQFNELPEKEISTPTRTHEDKISNELKDNKEDNRADIGSNLVDDAESVSTKLHDMKLNHEDTNVTASPPIDYETQPEKEEHNIPSSVFVNDTYRENVMEEIPVHPDNNDFANAQSVLAVSEIPAVPEQDVYTKGYDVDQPQLEQINNEVPLESNIDYNTQNQSQPIEENYVQEEAANENIQMEAVYNAEEVVPTQIGETHEQWNEHQEEAVTEQLETPAEIPESTEEFKTETNDTYYTEQAGENYTYEQGEYPQSQEYAYYDSTQPGAYAEETPQGDATQMYDPNYQQQYEPSDQNYVEGPTEEQVYEQHPQQYQETEGYQPPQPEYDMTQYDQQNYETQGQEGQVLHYEEGYTEQQHVADAGGEHPVGDVYDGQNIEGVVNQPIVMTQDFQQPAEESVAATGVEQVQVPVQNTS